MRCYTIRPRMLWDSQADQNWNAPGSPDIPTVFEADGASSIGILDQRGNMIYAQDQIGPIGFNRD